MRWRVHRASAREVVSQPVFMRTTEIWGWTREGGWNLRIRRTLSTRCKRELVPETRSECQEAPQICSGSLCQKLKNSSKRKLFHFFNSRRKLYLLSPTRMGEKLFHRIKNRKAEVFYTHIIWNALLIFSRKTIFEWVPAGTGAWDRSFLRCKTLFSISLINSLAYQLASHLVVWLFRYTQHHI